jgi:hypothetical protein
VIQGPQAVLQPRILLTSAAIFAGAKLIAAAIVVAVVVLGSATNSGDITPGNPIGILYGPDAVSSLMATASVSTIIVTTGDAVPVVTVTNPSITMSTTK